jgi:2-methylcitrate dehydratase
MSLAAKIARFAHNLTYDQLTHEAVHEAKRRMIDSFGCALGAWLEEPPKIARYLAGLSTSEIGATVLGTRHRSSPENAAFANGTMIRYLDYNDTYLGREPAHPSDNIAALLALAEAFEIGGADLILGIVAAYEVQCRLCDAYSIRKRGWDHVTYGSFSTVAGCGAMLGLTEEQIVHALGLAGVPNNAMRQTRVGELSMWKGCAFANAARNGVFATLLARLGMTGPSQVFEGEMGFFKEVCGGDAFDIERFGGQDGEPFMIGRTYIKKYPAEYHSQSAIDAALQILEEAGRKLPPGEVREVEIATFTASHEIIGREPEKWRPQSRETADHSLPYMTCAALVDGFVDQSSFAERRYRDESLLSLVAKTRVVADPGFDRLYPGKGIPNRVRVALQDGRVYERRVDAPRGHALNPMTDDEVVEKFRSMADSRLRPAQASEALDLMWRLDELDDIGELMETVVV